MKNVVISLKSVGKRYRLFDEKQTLVKSLLTPHQKPKEIWALKNVNLEIKRGETIGIIGENGSGKSTLLKLITGITSPTKGSIKVNGRVGSLIELGAGFHPDLTGRENVYLNGTLLGFTKKELDKKYQEIIDFADIGEYINQPVRTYSSGMAVRLGFSVAIHMDPEILLIDEVLAVGDEDFQGKSLNNLRKLKIEGKTIVLVSHNLGIVRSICEHVFLLKDGKLESRGVPDKVILDYRKLIFEDQVIKLNKLRRWGDGRVRITDIKIRNKHGTNRHFVDKEAFKIIVKIRFLAKAEDPIFGIIVRNSEGVSVFESNTEWAKIKTGKFNKGEYKYVTWEVKNYLNSGNYSISPAVSYSDGKRFYDWRDNWFWFSVKKPFETGGVINFDHKIEIN